ncbi:MAG: SpoIIE family protein phosphatase [Leptospiraceae bacterium]|nr:SpoIIE family protein phosphatase [Leptospiraceae bacterium]
MAQHEVVSGLPPVIEKEGANFALKPHPQLYLAARFLLRTAMYLAQSEGGKVFLRFVDGKTRIICSRDSHVTPVERQLGNVVMKNRLAQTLFQGQPLYTEEGDFVGESQKSYLAVPILVRSKSPVGVVILEKKLKDGHFGEEDLSLLQSLANSFGRLLASTALDSAAHRLLVSFSKSLLALLENMYLYKNYVEANFLLSEMMKVSKLINSTLDLQSLLESIMESAKLVLKAEASSLMLIDKKTQELYFNTITGENEKGLKEIRIPIGVGIAGYVAQTKQPLIVNDAQNDPRLFRQADKTINFVTRNMIAAPLLVRNEVIGVIEVINSIGREEFSEKDLELFQSFAEQSALAIHNRELIDSLRHINRELKKKVHELSSLHEISKVLISNLKEKELYNSIVRIIADELQAARVSILLYDNEADCLRIVAQVGLELNNYEAEKIPLSTSLAGIAFRQRKIIYTNDLLSSEYASYRNEKRYRTGACIIYPLMAGEEIYGLLTISEKNTPEGFSEDEFRLVSTIAVQVTQGIQNLRLLNEMMAKRAYEKELEITSSIQKSILPHRKLDSHHVDMGVISMPAKVMGGDFYDYYYFRDQEKYIFSIADVSGKSLPAALFMAVTSSILRTISREGKSPAETLYRANDLIYQDSHSGMFVTLFYSMYRAPTGEFSYSSAGHNEQLIYRALTHDFEILRTKGRPLGILDSKTHGPFGEGKTHLAKGDIIVLYTDGVVEAINDAQEEFGLERLKELVAQYSSRSAEDIVKEIYKHVRDFTGNEGLYDDFTLMVIKILE